MGNHVRVHGRFPGFRRLVEPSDAPRADGVNPAAFSGDRDLYRAYTDMVDKLKAVYDRLGRGERVEPKTVDQIAQERPARRPGQAVRAVSAILSGDIQGYSYARAGVNTAYSFRHDRGNLKLPPYRHVLSGDGCLAARRGHASHT